MVVLPEELWPEEKAVATGLTKRLDIGMDPRLIRSDCPNDVLLVDDIYERMKLEVRHEKLPDLAAWISVDKVSDLHLRVTTENIKLLRESPDYDPDLSDQDNFLLLALQFSRKVGPLRLALPGVLCTGKGLRLVEPAPECNLHVNSLLDRDNENIKINLETYMRKVKL
jgi:hypothetical protein